MKQHHEVSHTIHEKREIHILNFVYDIEKLAAFDKVTEEKYLHNQNLLFDIKNSFLKKKVTVVDHPLFVLPSMVEILNDKYIWLHSPYL